MSPDKKTAEKPYKTDDLSKAKKLVPVICLCSVPIPTVLYSEL